MNQEKIKLIVNRKDPDGNRLAYEESTGKLQLSQANEPDRWRPIGRIVEDNDIMVYHKYEKEKDKYLKFKAWSVYYIVLDIVDAVRYETETFVYYINKGDLFKFGHVTKDKGHGYGSKVVCPIRYWTAFPKNKASKKLLENLGYEWFDELETIFKDGTMKPVSKFVAQERKTSIVYPKSELVFRPFRETPYTNVKVMLIGDSPFPEGDGLAFSLDKQRTKMPPENKALLDWIEEDVYDGFNLNRSEDLTYLAQNGVLLLNNVLTCNHYSRDAHFDKGWEALTKAVISKLINDSLHAPVVFILLGHRVNTLYFPFIEKLNKGKHLLLSGPYPGEETNNPNLFSTCNKYLTDNHLRPIPW